MRGRSEIGTHNLHARRRIVRLFVLQPHGRDDERFPYSGARVEKVRAAFSLRVVRRETNSRELGIVFRSNGNSRNKLYAFIALPKQLRGTGQPDPPPKRRFVLGAKNA